ncbi:hypothetical protein TYRP_008607 [Tyrophagus putrescentiae]|nr:hypothetical protein TYRP_008607 [Tyrophagus putrescentiae]
MSCPTAPLIVGAGLPANQFRQWWMADLLGIQEEESLVRYLKIIVSRLLETISEGTAAIAAVVSDSSSAAVAGVGRHEGNRSGGSNDSKNSRRRPVAGRRL